MDWIAHSALAHCPSSHLFTLLKLTPITILGSQFLTHNCHTILGTFLQPKIVILLEGDVVEYLDVSSSDLLRFD